MFSLRSTGAALGLAVVLAIPATSAAARPPAPHQPPAPHSPHVSAVTKANALEAMHGEAFAYAKYDAFAGEAARAGVTSLAALFTQTAQTELDDHFAAEAAVAGVVGTTAANLTDAIAGETYETTTMYPGFAAQATADGCTAAAALFTEIAADEAGHAAAYQAALASLTDPGVTVPAPPTVDVVAIVASAPACSGATNENLRAAMIGESFAQAKYGLFADRATKDGHPEIAALFDGTAQVELREHFAGEANLAGLVMTNVSDLVDAIMGEGAEAMTTYPGYAAQADAAHDRKAAQLFRDIASDELAHAMAFGQALAAYVRG